MTDNDTLLRFESQNIEVQRIKKYFDAIRYFVDISLGQDARLRKSNHLDKRKDGYWLYFIRWKLFIIWILLFGAYPPERLCITGFQLF